MSELEYHQHCDHWPDACCWCGIGLTEKEARWQDIEWTPRDMRVLVPQETA